MRPVRPPVVNRHQPVLHRFELDQIVVAHDVEDRCFHLEQLSHHLLGVEPLILEVILHFIREPQQIAGKNNGLRPERPRLLHEPPDDSQIPVKVRPGENPHFIQSSAVFGPTFRSLKWIAVGQGSLNSF